MTEARLDCPHCGAVFRVPRTSCPECGSDASTGWRDSEDVDYLSVEIPDYLPDDLDASKSRTNVWYLIAAIAALFGMLAFAVLR